MKIEKQIETLDRLMPMLPEIIRGACVLAVYAGEDWGKRQIEDDEGYGFGADSYEYLEKYIQGGIELCRKFGQEDFYNDYAKYFEENIKPELLRIK